MPCLQNGEIVTLFNRYKKKFCAKFFLRPIRKVTAMKRTLRTMLGVTLLEIMLVLAIASMVIVMSIKYYQSATSSQQANAVLAQIQSIQAAADSISQGAGGYSTVTSATLAALLPKNGLISPWNGTITFAGSATSYLLTLGTMPASICPIIKVKLSANGRITGLGSITCPASGTVSFAFTYSSS